MVVLGIQGALRVRGTAGIERRFFVCFVLVAVVGFGSMAFHGTMLKVAQAMDELPMVYGGLGYAYCLVNRSHDDPVRARRWRWGLGLYGAFFTAAYFSLEAYFTFFVVTYAVLMAGLILGGLRVAWGATGSPEHRRLLALAAGPFVAAFLFFWLPEHVFFACDLAIQSLELHAWYLSRTRGLWAPSTCSGTAAASGARPVRLVRGPRSARRTNGAQVGPFGEIGSAPVDPRLTTTSSARGLALRPVETATATLLVT